MAALVAATLAVVSGPAPAGSTPSFGFSRISGTTRHDTAAKTALAAFPNGSSEVVLARDAAGSPDADALGANFVAGNRRGPILLTTTDALPPETDAALAQLKPTRVTIMGGASAVGTAVEDALRSRGYTVQRIQGVDRYATAATAALLPEAATAVVDGKLSAFLARSEGAMSPDAVAAGPASFAAKLPVLLTTRDALPSDTAAAINNRGYQQLFVLGGHEAVSLAQEQALTSAGITVVRIAGENRSGTAVALASQLAVPKLGFVRTHVNLARGDDSADALAAGPHGGLERAALLITESACVLDDATTGRYLREQSAQLQSGHIFGGTSAVCQAVEDQATLAARGEAPRPASPSTLAFSASSSSNTVNLTIGGSPTPTVTSYKIYRSASSTSTCPAFGSGYTAVGSVADATPNTGDTTSTQTFADTTTAPRSTYCYATTAVGTGGAESNALVIGPVTTGGSPVGSANDPAPPAAVSYSGSSTSSDVTLTITDSPTREVTSYSVYRAPAGATCPTANTAYVKIGSVNDPSPGVASTGTATFTDTTAAASTTYCYAVSAVTASAESAAIATGPVTTGSGGGGGGGGGGGAGAPQPPRRITYNTVANSSAVTITIEDSTTASVTAYDVYRVTVTGGATTCPAFSTYTKLGTVSDPSPGTGSSGSTSFVDQTAAGTTAYCYAVTSVSGGQSSAPLVVGPLTSGSANGGVAPPARVSWSTTGGSSTITLVIEDSPTAGVTQYNVRRAVATSATACPTSGYGAPVTVANTASTSETYQDTGATAGTTYCYLVSAVGSGGQESQAVVAGPVTSPASNA